jgi:hypothetical protein
MALLPSLAPLRAIGDRVAAAEAAMTRRENIFIFLVVRFLLMSGMVVAFAWACLDLHP